jgi:hypothetical protein
MLVIGGELPGEVFLSVLFERVGVGHQIENGGWNGEGIEIPLNLFLLRISDERIVNQERCSIRLVVRIIDRRSPVAQERDAMISVTILAATSHGLHEK